MAVLTHPLATHEEKCSLVSPSCFRAKVCSDSHPTKTARVQTKHKFIFSILQQFCIAGDMWLYTNIHLLQLSRDNIMLWQSIPILPTDAASMKIYHSIKPRHTKH